MDERPFLTLVVPAYNKESQIDRLLQGLVDQCRGGYARTEIIVVDDASKDGTAIAAGRFADRHAQVRLVKLAENSGVHAARNAGMGAARGAWIGFLDGDDYLLDGGLGTIYAALEELQDRYEIVFFPLRTSDSGESTGYAREGEYGIGAILLGKIFRPNKNCVGLINHRLLERSAAAWYAPNLDFLFWREIEFEALGQKIYFRDRVVGIYDKGTAGSLGKLRRSKEYIVRHAEAKTEALTRFLEKMDAHLSPYREYSRELFGSLLRDFSFCRSRKRFLGRHLRLIRSYRLGPAFAAKYLTVACLLHRNGFARLRRGNPAATAIRRLEGTYAENPG